MHELYELKDKLMDELEEYASKDMNAGTLEVVDKLTHTIKNLCKIIEEYEYSGMYDGVSYADRDSRGGRGRNYSRESNRGRYAMARRDSRGRYSSTGSLVDELRELMEEAPDQRTRQEFEHFIKKMETM